MCAGYILDDEPDPYGWIVNVSLAESGTTDPILRSRAALEQDQLDRIRELAERVWTLPWRPDL